MELHNCDCREYLRGMESESVDFILTDPPYGINYQSNRRTKTAKFRKICGDEIVAGAYVYGELFRVLKNNSACAVFCSWKNIEREIKKLEVLFNIKNVIVWNKGGGGLGDLKHTLATDYELVIVCHKGLCPIRGKRCGSVWNYGKVHNNAMAHPTEKPVELIASIVEKFSDEGGVVLDPFAGSGTTGLACKQTGRDFIGIEIDEEYYSIAKERLGL